MISARKQNPEEEHAAFSDSRLVAECLLGREPAWSALIYRYKNLIYSIPIKYGFAQEEASDIFQAVCMDLVHELGNLREPEALAGWLIRVAHNKCFHRRKEQRRFVTQDDEQPEPAISPEQVPENVLRQAEEEQLLRLAVRELSPRCRQLVERLFFEAPVRPYQEIAQELGLATGSIGFIRKRCLEKLRQRLETTGMRS